MRSRTPRRSRARRTRRTNLARLLSSGDALYKGWEKKMSSAADDRVVQLQAVRIRRATRRRGKLHARRRTQTLDLEAALSRQCANGDALSSRTRPKPPMAVTLRRHRDPEQRRRPESKNGEPPRINTRGAARRIYASSMAWCDICAQVASSEAPSSRPRNIPVVSVA